MKKLFTFFAILLFAAYSFGQPDAADFGVDYGYLYGSNNYYSDADDDFGGWVTDGNGNAFVIHANKTIDQTQSNIVITKLSLTDGSVAWSKTYGSNSRGEALVEPGGNGITAGGAGTSNIAIDADGNLYFTCSIYDGFYRVYVAKISSTDGSISWEKSWKNADNDLASSEAIAYALDVQAGKVFVTGTTNNMDLLLVYDASNGNLISTTRLDLYSGSGDKSYAVKASSDGNTVYIGGWTARNYQDGFLAKLTNGGTTLAWYDYIDIPSASRINDIDLDASGNIYLNVDIHGTDTYLEIIKVDADGNFVWARNYGGGNDRFNGTTVTVMGDYLYVSGRVGLHDDYTNYDNYYGDGFFAKYDLDGNLSDRYFYFTGTDNSVLAADWVKGVIEYNGKIYLGGSIYPYGSNYTGSWFVAPDHGSSETITLTNSTTADAFITDEAGYDAGLTMGTVEDFAGAVHEDITNSSATTFGATQLYFWGLDKSAASVENFDAQVSVYPNPASDKVFITTADNSQFTNISVIDLNGKTLISQDFENVNIKTIDVSQLAKGVYFIRIKTDNYETTQKLLVK